MAPAVPSPGAPAPGAASPPLSSPGSETAPSGEGLGTLAIDKFIDFILIFVGLYAAIAVQRYQDGAREKEQYLSLLRDFDTEIAANLEQEASIEKDLGKIDDTEPGSNLGPMGETFERFFTTIDEDVEVVHCLHEEFVVEGRTRADLTVDHGGKKLDCHALYSKFDAKHREGGELFDFEPAVLTPFYRKEVWQLYLADGVKTFRNKELAVRIGEIYANAQLIEEQVQDIENTYNDAFMVQVGRTAATDQELAEIVHDEEVQGTLPPGDMPLLLSVSEKIKEERYAVVETQRILELKVERLKRTVLLMREEIEQVRAQIAEERKVQGAKD